ncbi:MAG: c-type cytochrome domain-containing protein [Saprospiraceae bacterium]|nr:c-type cytochrome domain-containing protein [Saprospiraceae bacterium]
MINLLGKLHPLIVHLPIGILLLNVGLIFITRNKKYAAAKNILPLTLLIGAISAVAACITGLLLSQNGDYDIGILNYHKWLGIVVALLALGLYFLKLQENRIIGILLAILLTITGHFGGTLTHGENYLAPSNSPQGGERTPYAGNIQEALIYKDLVQPILQEKCVSCHNANKQKGKLRLDEPDFILKGGKNGAAVVAGEVKASELIKRLLLELNEEHHMPPKGKPQPTEAEIELLKWWIAEGCSFDKKVSEIPHNEAIKKVLSTYQKEEVPIQNEFVPTAKVEPADEKALESLRKLGIVVLPIEPNSPFLSVNFISVPSAADSLIQKLQPIATQIAWLKLDGTKISNNALSVITKMPNLTRLSLNNTSVSDLNYLSNLKELRYLSLVGTQVNIQNLLALSKLAQLQQLYLFQTNITRVDSIQIQQLLPKTKLDFGNYQVATLASDTTVFKKKVSK